MKISVIGGGNLGGAIAYGALLSNKINDKDLTISHCKDFWKQQFEIHNYQVRCLKDNLLAIQEANIILLAVKPWIAREVLEEIKDTINPHRQSIVSVVARLSLESIETYLGTKHTIPLFTAIPNTAIALRKSTTFICSKNASTSQIDSIVDFFDAMGKTFLVSENQMGAYMSLSSCGIAYCLKYIDAAMKGGVQMGIDQTTALEIVRQTMQGALALLDSNHTLPQTEIDKVTTPGGITLKGLEAMEKHQFTHAVIQGLKASQ